MPQQSYIWDVTNPNTPDVELLPPSPLCCLRFNPKSSDTLIGGSYNGLITFYDLRKAGGGIIKEATPFSASIIEKSHHDPVYDIFWINSKTGNQVSHHIYLYNKCIKNMWLKLYRIQCVSVSTDGQILWWDTRKLSEPTDSLLLCTDTKAAGGGQVKKTKTINKKQSAFYYHSKYVCVSPFYSDIGRLFA